MGTPSLAPTRPSSPALITPVLQRRNHRLPSCSASLFFQMPAPHPFGVQQPSEWRFYRFFCICFKTYFSFLSFFARPRQTPSGLLLAHSPLLSGIHFWSSLSPVAPLSPARLQGHSSLFQVRSTQVKKNPKKQSVVFGRHPEHTCYFLVDKRQVKVIWLVFAKQQCLWSEWRLFGSRSCRGVLFQCLREGEEILWILPVWAQGSRSEQGGLVWELLLIYQTHKTAPPHTKYTL